MIFVLLEGNFVYVIFSICDQMKNNVHVEDTNVMQ